MAVSFKPLQKNQGYQSIRLFFCVAEVTCGSKPILIYFFFKGGVSHVFPFQFYHDGDPWFLSILQADY